MGSAVRGRAGAGQRVTVDEVCVRAVEKAVMSVDTIDPPAVVWICGGRVVDDVLLSESELDDALESALRGWPAEAAERVRGAGRAVKIGVLRSHVADMRAGIR